MYGAGFFDARSIYRAKPLVVQERLYFSFCMMISDIYNNGPKI